MSPFDDAESEREIEPGPQDVVTSEDFKGTVFRSRRKKPNRTKVVPTKRRQQVQSKRQNKTPNTIKANKNNVKRPGVKPQVPTNASTETTEPTTPTSSGDCKPITVQTNATNVTVIQPAGCENAPTKIVVLPSTPKP